MTSIKAIEILEDMKIRLLHTDEHSCGPWKSQVTSYMLVFFGKDSPQYFYISKFEFYQYGAGDLSFQLTNAKPSLENFISDCITYINNCGLKKREWKHILIMTQPALFWTIFSGIVIFAFWLGGQLASNKTYQAPIDI